VGLFGHKKQEEKHVLCMAVLSHLLCYADQGEVVTITPGNPAYVSIYQLLIQFIEGRPDHVAQMNAAADAAAAIAMGQLMAARKEATS
jgi:hypothetical protein